MSRGYIISITFWKQKCHSYRHHHSVQGFYQWLLKFCRKQLDWHFTVNTSYNNVSPSRILHSDIYRGGLEFRRISTVAQKHFHA